MRRVAKQPVWSADGLDGEPFCLSDRLMPGVAWIKCATQEAEHRRQDSLFHLLELGFGPFAGGFQIREKRVNLSGDAGRLKATFTALPDRIRNLRFSVLLHGSVVVRGKPA
jgi:hypothetical protein